MSQAEWKKYYDTWLKRMQKCIDHKGQYSERNKAILDDKLLFFIIRFKI